MRPIACPEVYQELYYSGHKGYHGIKFQSIVTPDGLISSLYGPIFGPVGDWRMWKDCGIVDILRGLFTPHVDVGVGANVGINRDMDILYLYGDPAYTLSYGIIGPFSR